VLVSLAIDSIEDSSSLGICSEIDKTLSGKFLELASKSSHTGRSLELGGGMLAGMASLTKACFKCWIPYFSSQGGNTRTRSKIGTISWICHRLTVLIGQSRRIFVYQVNQFSYIYLQLLD